jgi:hypothetical protein
MTIWRMRIACWILKAPNTHTQTHCVIYIAFPLQQWLPNAPQRYVMRILPVLFLTYILDHWRESL